MHTHMVGDDVRRRMNPPLADIVYLQQRPIRLMPRTLRRRLAGLRTASGHRATGRGRAGERR